MVSFRNLLGPLGAALVSFGALCPSLRAQPVCERTWQLEETVRLGSADGAVVLNRVNDLAIGPNGRVYLLQLWDPIRVFEPDGRPAGTIGRAGEGPGEFPSPPSSLGWRGDTLWVSHRLGTQFLDSAGTEIRRVSFRIPLPAEGSHLAPGVPLPDGTFLPLRTVTEDLGRFFWADRAALRRVSASGEIADTVAIVERHLAAFTIERQTDAHGWGLLRSHPLGPWVGISWLPVATAPDRSAIVLLGDVRDTDQNASFDLLKISFRGDTLLHRSIPYARQPITRAEESLQRDAFAARVARSATPWDSSDPDRKRRIARNLIDFPAYYPPVRRIVVGDDGTIWLLRQAWPSGADIWEIYGDDGRLEGSVQITTPVDHASWDPRLHIFRASRTQVWGMTIGEFDIPYVHSYTVVRRCT